MGATACFSVRRVLNTVQGLSASVTDVRTHAKDHDFSALRADLKGVSVKSSKLVDDMSGTLWDVGSAMPLLGRDLSNARTIAKVAERLSGAAEPLLRLFRVRETSVLMPC